MVYGVVVALVRKNFAWLYRCIWFIDRDYILEYCCGERERERERVLIESSGIEIAFRLFIFKK